MLIFNLDINNIEIDNFCVRQQVCNRISLPIIIIIKLI